ncbi:hypothetical protein NDU88_001725 [Pleurodeles waltl]|uniref:Secreted protein n=1 Tax=Pleurodeles waltl TaxID=8319 RepID=A0AAV7SDN7_PLEWA|nr:hypothetical protein NDU88_001725 [Pleurodeles waltl]
MHWVSAPRGQREVSSSHLFLTRLVPPLLLTAHSQSTGTRGPGHSLELGSEHRQWTHGPLLLARSPTRLQGTRDSYWANPIAFYRIKHYKGSTVGFDIFAVFSSFSAEVKSLSGMVSGAARVCNAALFNEQSEREPTPHSSR